MVKKTKKLKVEKELSKEFDRIKRIDELSFRFRLGSKAGWVKLQPGLLPERLKSGWGTGNYRKLWVGLDSQPVGRPLQIYYGPWRKATDRYIVIKQNTRWLLELGLSLTSYSVTRENDRLILKHLMNFSKRNLSKEEMADRVRQAMKRAYMLGLSQIGTQDSIMLGEIHLAGGERKPVEEQAVLKRLVLTAIAKRWDYLFGNEISDDLTERRRNRVIKSPDEIIWPGANNPEYTKKLIRFEVNIERKAQRHKDHQIIINTLKDLLEINNFKCNATPEDLRAIGKEKWVFEVKAWNPELELSAIWHAIGQVKWYCFKRDDGFKPVIVLDHQPKDEVVYFVEVYCKIPLLWVDRKHGVLYGPLALKLLGSALK